MHFMCSNKVSTRTSRVSLKVPDLQKKLRILNEKSGFHSTIRYTLLCSRYMGLLPLVGLSCPKSHELRFELRSPYTVFYFITFMGQLVMFILSFYWVIQSGLTVSNLRHFVFYLSSLISSVILVNNGYFWPDLIKQVEALESNLPPFTRNLAKLSNITMVFILVTAIVEHLTWILYGFAVAKSCEPNNIVEKYFLYQMPWIFNYTPYTLWKGILSETFNVQSTLLWSFNDLIVIVISIYLAEHFITHNELLTRALKHEYNISFNEFRIQYLNIVRLVKLINEHIGIHILTCFAGNLYWICTQLFYILNKTHAEHFIACENKARHGIVYTIYFVYSFSYLVLRTLLVLLLAARIHSTSLLPLVKLYEVSSSKFNIEVERYIDQINKVKVALNGLDFFYVTRSTILTLSGTIVTYELVLLQFNSP